MKQNKNKSVCCCITSKGDITYIPKTTPYNNISFLKFLKRLKLPRNTIFVLDNVRFHHAKLLRPFLEKNKDKIELMFLPAYSPDFNPIERVWWYMRKKITNNRYTETLKNRMIEFWKMFSHYQKSNQIIVNLCNLNFSV